ncbi:MAG: phosphoribosyltransferase [Opitutae bacterium]|nr:phosphoribosyltransferase [Opitutae bacterium]
MQAVNHFWDREHAGQALASELLAYAGRTDTVVVALPNGGVAIGVEVARALRAPLDFCVVRKLATPAFPEFAFGALASGGVRVLDREAMAQLRLSDDEAADILAHERADLERQEALFRPARPLVPVTGRIAILVDDGASTGATLRAAAAAARLQYPKRLVVAAPVGSSTACALLGAVADEVVCPVRPEPFHAVGLWYVHFPELPEHEVRELLEHAEATAAGRGSW